MNTSISPCDEKLVWPSPIFFLADIVNNSIPVLFCGKYHGCLSPQNKLVYLSLFVMRNWSSWPSPIFFRTNFLNNSSLCPRRLIYITEEIHLWQEYIHWCTPHPPPNIYITEEIHFWSEYIHHHRCTCSLPEYVSLKTYFCHDYMLEQSKHIPNTYNSK